MAVKLVCCCTPRAWTRFIAWTTTIVSIILLLLTLLLLLFPSTSKDNTSTAEKSLGRTVYENIDPAFILWTLTMGIILLYGFYKENRNFLLSWVILSVAFLIAYLIYIIIGVTVFEQDHIPGLINIIGATATDILCIYVVSVHRRDLEEMSPKIV